MLDSHADEGGMFSDVGNKRSISLFITHDVDFHFRTGPNFKDSGGISNNILDESSIRFIAGPTIITSATAQASKVARP